MQKQKPPYGHECNHCGLCCEAELCPLGQRLFRQITGPCPALTWKDDESACGLVTSPLRHAPGRAIAHGAKNLSTSAALLIGAGVGCDACLETEKPVKTAQFAARLAAATLSPDQVERLAATWAPPRQRLPAKPR